MTPFLNLHKAVKSNNYLLSKKLLRSGTDPNKVDHQGFTPLHTLVQLKSNNLMFFELLLDAGADPNIQDYNGNTPLHNVLLTFPMNDDTSKQIVAMLIENGSDPTIQNQEGLSIFDLAQGLTDDISQLVHTSYNQYILDVGDVLTTFQINNFTNLGVDVTNVVLDLIFPIPKEKKIDTTGKVLDYFNKLVSDVENIPDNWEGVFQYWVKKGAVLTLFEYRYMLNVILTTLEYDNQTLRATNTLIDIWNFLIVEGGGGIIPDDIQRRLNHNYNDAIDEYDSDKLELWALLGAEETNNGIDFYQDWF